MFPYSRPRPGQIGVAERVAETIHSGGCLCVEAPTGFGKTVAILYGIRKSGAEKTLYLVRTRNELVQPLIESIRLGFKPVYLYSKKAMCPLLVSGSIDIIDFWENCRLLRRVNMCPYYNNLDKLEPHSLYKLIYSIKNPFKTTREIARRGYCPFYALKQLIPYSDIIIMTYPYLFNPSIREGFFSIEELKGYVVAIDEAHSLVSIADIVEQRVSTDRIEKCIEEIKRYAPYATSLIDRLYTILDYLDKNCVEERLRVVDKGFLQDILGDPDTWFDLVDDIRSVKLKETGYDPETRVYCLPIASFVASLYMGFESFMYRSGDRRYLVSKPIDQSIITKNVFNNASSIILFSGTLPSPDYYSDVLGISKPIEYINVVKEYGPVFPVENQVLVVVTYVSSRYSYRGEAMYRLYADMIGYAFNKLENGIMLVVYPSYEFMNSILRHISVDNVFVEKRGTRIDDVIEYCMSRRKCLVNAVASGKLCEGIEIVDKGTRRSLVKIVFIAGVPYPQPDDYIDLSIRYLSKKIGRDNAWRHLYLDIAVTRTRQAIGRAIRGPDDKAVYILADNRFLDRRILSKIGYRVNKIVSSRTVYQRVVDVLATEFLD